MKIKHFNLVEVIIAMGIVMVCITTMMGLFSAGMNITRDSVRLTYGNVVIEQLDGLATNYPEIAEGIPFHATAAEAQKMAYKSSTGTDWTGGLKIQAAEAACTTPIDTRDQFLKNVYYNSSAPSTQKYGLLKIEFQTKIDNTDVVDFTILGRMWYENKASGTTIDVSSGDDVTLNKKLYIEISWPKTDPYYNRILSGQYISKEWEIYNE